MIDVGDPKNLHPPRKEEVGERLALWALGTTYGERRWCIPGRCTKG